jgi:hypothetical protein
MGKVRKTANLPGHDPFAKKKVEYERDYGQFSIAKIYSVHEDLGLVVGEIDEKVIGAIPIEWFNKVDEIWKPNGLACPYIYDSNRRQQAVDKYNEIKDKINDQIQSD